MNTSKDQPPAPAGNFIALLQGKTGGVTLPDLDRQLADLVNQVTATGRKGSLTYKIAIIPNAKAGVRIEDEVTVKEPKAETGVSFFWVGQGGALLKNDPKQTELKLTVVPDETASPLKTAAQ